MTAFAIIFYCIFYAALYFLFKFFVYEMIDVAIHYSLDITDFSTCPVIFDHCIWLEHV